MTDYRGESGRESENFKGDMHIKIAHGHRQKCKVGLGEGGQSGGK